MSVPLFNKIELMIDGQPVTIRRNGNGNKIESITCGGKKLEGWFVSHSKLKEGKELVVNVQ